MKCLICLLQIMLLGIIVAFGTPLNKPNEVSSVSNNLIIRIEGTVWTPNRQPVSDVYVELQNENYSSLSRIRTSSSGRFTFVVARQGNYNVKVLASGTNYLDYTEAVELYTGLRQGGSDGVYLDIYLQVDKRKMNSGGGITEAVFIQDVPEEARKLFKNGVKALIDKEDKGIDELEQALIIFPNYYDALNKLGLEYVTRKDYQKAVSYLIKSIDINQRSFSSFYALAYAAYQLKHRPEALEAARAATILQANSVNAQLLYGTLLRLDGNYEKAEKALVQAKSLSKNAPIAEVYWQLALLYNKLGRNKEAADELTSYIKLTPNGNNKKEIQNLIAKLQKAK